MDDKDIAILFKNEISKLHSTPNSKAYTEILKKVLAGVEETTEFYDLYELEKTWKNLEANSPLLKEERDRSDYYLPLDYFMSSIEKGQYPPPEILLAINACFEHYFECKGEKSLDEIFFYGKHKKKSSPAFIKAKIQNYMLFDFLYAGFESLQDDKIKGKSLVEKAEIYLKTFNDNDIDPETFLRGYRRWKKIFRSNSND